MPINASWITHSGKLCIWQWCIFSDSYIILVQQVVGTAIPRWWLAISCWSAMLKILELLVVLTSHIIDVVQNAARSQNSRISTSAESAQHQHDVVWTLCEHCDITSFSTLQQRCGNVVKLCNFPMLWQCCYNIKPMLWQHCQNVVIKHLSSTLWQCCSNVVSDLTKLNVLTTLPQCWALAGSPTNE